jgi:hypothetical protein
LFQGRKGKGKAGEGLEDVGNNNYDKNEKPKLVGRLTFKELISSATTLLNHFLQR